MKLGAFSVLDAVRRPWASLSFEGYVIWWVLVSCGENSRVCFFEDFYVVVEGWNHLVAFGNGECATWTEIVLHVYNYNCVCFAYSEVFFQINRSLII